MRIASAAIGLPLLALFIWAGSPWFSLLLTAAAAAGAFELCQMVRQRGRRPVSLVAAVWAVALVAAGHSLAAGASSQVIVQAAAAGAALAAVAWLLAAYRRELGPADWGISAGAALYTGGLLAHGPLLRGLEQGREWVFLAVLVTFAADTSAFFVGRAFGVRPLAPTVSPGKTWEGALAGLIGAIGASALLATAFGLDVTLAAALALGTLMGVVGQLGDLAESRLKRFAGAKDSGWLVPGHGGVLDRLDSIVFNLVLVYYFVVWGLQ